MSVKRLPTEELGVRDAPERVGDRAAAVVLTFRRPRLATQVVRGLLEEEGFDAGRVLLVVNGEGGLDDAALESAVHVLRLPENVGPAGGYRHALAWVREHFAVDWVYLCEDDVGLFDLPTPRVRRLLRQLAEADADAHPIGAVVAYGRDLNRRSGSTTPHVPQAGHGPFEEVSVAAWGATLLSVRVLDDGVFPDEGMFFGYEDFDFWLRMRQAGFRLLLDVESTQVLGSALFTSGRQAALAPSRPLDEHEPWRRYYEARNFFVLRDRYGHVGWTVAHLWKSARRIQLSPTRAHRMAVLRGLADGFRRVTGKNPVFVRQTGERL